MHFHWAGSKKAREPGLPMGDIVDFISALKYDAIPEKAVQTARLCILDAVGCMAVGMQNPAVSDFAKTISEKKRGSAIIAGTPLTSTRAWASFVNSHACTFFDLDDGHRKAQGHPGGVIIPLALMLAAENGCTGEELIAAIVAGYETAVRSAQVMRQAGGPRKGSGGWSMAGGVAAAAKLCRLSEQQIKNALGLAEYYAPQAPQDRSLAFPSSMKEGMAWAAHAAISIVDLAATGFDAMLPSLAAAGQCDDLGNNWEICSVYFKKYACCRFSHPVLDGLLPLVHEHEVKPDDIMAIKVTSFAKALLLDTITPDNPVAAMYSIPFAIGCLLARGKVGPGEMTADALTERQILQIARKVTIEEDLDITDQFPEKCLARVTVTFKSGEPFKSGTLSAKGDPDNPYSHKELRAKFFDLAAPLLGETIDSVYHQIMTIHHESPQKLWDRLHTKID
jgi:2-methylcitrate dehydratase PrpD